MTEHEDAADAGLPRRLLSGAVSLAWFAGAVVLAVLLWPSSLGGCTTLTIVSGHSMEPTYYTGDLVVSRCGPVDVGDVIVYSPPDVGGARVIHRIVDGDEQGWIVQGDNNDFLDPWMPTQENILGSAVVHLPHVGKVASILLSPMTWISLMIIALAIVVWPTRRDPDDADGADDAAGQGGDDAGDPEHASPEPPAEHDVPLADRLGALAHRAAGTLTGVAAAVRSHAAAGAAATGRALSGRRARRVLGRALVVALVAVPLGAGAATAHAALLLVNGFGSGSYAVTGRCTTATVTVTNTTPSSTGVAPEVVVQVPASCAGTAGRLQLAGVTNPEIAFTAVAGAQTITVPGGFQAASVTGAALTFDSWGVPTTWTLTGGVPAPTGPLTAGTTNTSLTVVGWSSSSFNQVCATVQVSSTTPGVRWRVNINTWFDPWSGQTTGYSLQGASASVGTASGGVVPVDEGTWTNPAGAPQTFQICNNNLPAPPAPGTVVVAGNVDTNPTLGSWYRNGPLVCVDVSVRSYNGNKTWRVDVNYDLQPFGGQLPTLSGRDAAYLQATPVAGPPRTVQITGTGTYAEVHHQQWEPILFTLCG